MMDVVRQAVPVVQLDLEKPFMASPVRAVIDLGVTHSFVSRDSKYLEKLRYFGTLIKDPKQKSYDQIFLWRNTKVRIRDEVQITFYDNRSDELKDCRTKLFERNGFRMEIYISANDLRFSKIILGHKQLKLLGISLSNETKEVYLSEEIDNNLDLTGQLFSITCVETLLIQDLVKRNVFNNTTEVDEMRDHFKRIYSQNQWRVKKPIHNEELEDRVKIVHRKAELREFSGITKCLPERTVCKYHPE